MEKLLRQIASDIASIKATIDVYIKKTEDHEKRIRFLEKGLWIGIGILGLIEFILKFMRK